ncbi:hypothetical protein V6N11_070900 [Hibiscus sabdariffa]|uniref:Uncharacterized protein n=2 Tax=Hibiscus sabdariffa TaxID=183260 RepID=A0ABR1ZR79_9ROSI
MRARLTTLVIDGGWRISNGATVNGGYSQLRKMEFMRVDWSWFNGAWGGRELMLNELNGKWLDERDDSEGSSWFCGFVGKELREQPFGSLRDHGAIVRP